MNYHSRELLKKRAFIEVDDGSVNLIKDPMANLEDCHQFMLDVLKGDYDINCMTANKRQLDRFNQTLTIILPRMHRFSEVYIPGFQYHPAITFFLEEYRQHPISSLFPQEKPRSRVSQNATVSDVFVDFVRNLKLESKRQGLSKKIADHDAKLVKNRKALRKWEDELFRRVARPVIIRLDLDYHAVAVPAAELESHIERERIERELHVIDYHSGSALEIGHLPEMRVTLEEVQRDRKKFFQNMKSKPSLFRHLVGYVWRFEYAHKAGFHLHLLLAFDGSKVDKHVWRAQEIGEYWSNEITRGRGRFHNCNMAWNKDSPLYGLGPIDWHEKESRANLRSRVLPYLAKTEQYVLARPYKGCKLMGSGFAHRSKNSVGGRPRMLREAIQPTRTPM